MRCSVLQIGATCGSAYIECATIGLFVAIATPSPIFVAAAAAVSHTMSRKRRNARVRPAVSIPGCVVRFHERVHNGTMFIVDSCACVMFCACSCACVRVCDRTTKEPYAPMVKAVGYPVRYSKGYSEYSHGYSEYPHDSEFHTGHAQRVACSTHTGVL